jgi:hypothetical protein
MTRPVVQSSSRAGHLPVLGSRGIGRRATGNDGARDETGAVLILALVFIVGVSLVITALAGWASNDLRNTSNFATDRSALYAVGGATELAISNARYSYSATLTTSACPGTNPVTLDGESVKVWCSTVPFPALSPPNPSITRAVTFSACLASISQSSCTASPYIQAVVYFDDISSTSNVDNCTSTSNQTCGTSMIVDSWIVQSGQN